MLNTVPTLDELAAHPERASEIPPAIAAGLLAQLAGLQSVLLARALAPAESGHGEPQDRLLTIAEAAGLLSIPKAFTYELARRGEIPTVRIGRKYIRVPLHALQKCLAQKGLDKGISYMYSATRKRGRYDGRGVATDSPKARPDAEAIRRATRLAPEQRRQGRTE